MFLKVRLGLHCCLLLLGIRFPDLHLLQTSASRIFPYNYLLCILFPSHDIPPLIAILFRKLYTFCARFNASMDSLPSATSTELASLIPVALSIHSVFIQF